jgi:predicted house-cleaning NTP pyrophosphatase (Maf/HAM1 superfamily)
MEIQKIENVVDRTRVFFERMNDETIMSYVENGEPFGKAGGYGI